MENEITITAINDPGQEYSTYVGVSPTGKKWEVHAPTDDFKSVGEKTYIDPYYPELQEWVDDVEYRLAGLEGLLTAKEANTPIPENLDREVDWYLQGSLTGLTPKQITSPRR